MEETKTWWEYLLLAIITIPLFVALVAGMIQQVKMRYGSKRRRKRW
ncbi:hypothetical protein [Pontibacter russatus]|nr:hypothetical protein [Pontibacter russatus]